MALVTSLGHALQGSLPDAGLSWEVFLKRDAPQLCTPSRTEQDRKKECEAVIHRRKIMKAVSGSHSHYPAEQNVYRYVKKVDG